MWITVGYVKRNKKIVVKELGFETGDIKCERIFDNGVFKGVKIEILKWCIIKSTTSVK